MKCFGVFGGFGVFWGLGVFGCFGCLGFFGCLEQPSVLNKFFSELQYSPAFGRESRKFAGGVSKYAKLRHFLAHPVV